ncbi:enoyl-CoA hydratase/isomerase family protein [Nakamurella alba]|uniref:enoyl-CoA hydratase/isomerase family protein n=1 Tax=Nakamurella alba TaxID=2665158 RepID=UPI0018AB8489|nr:enoyl-CoA hydratase/isomerase family protein [Nakamurella alba]
MNVAADRADRSVDSPVSEDLLLRVQDRVAVLTIDREKKHNALTPGIWADLRDTLAELEQDPEVRAVVLTGAGDRSFSAGGDIESFAAVHTLSDQQAFIRSCMLTFGAIEDSTLPVIAAVNGWALGGGMELALACDIVVAAENALFGIPEAAIGLVPGFGMVRGPQVLGRHWTKYLTLTGFRIDAAKAEKLGLVQEVAPVGGVVGRAVEIGRAIAANAPLAVSVGKSYVNRGRDQGDFATTNQAVSMLHATQDAKEGFAAFLEKRPPEFHGR